MVPDHLRPDLSVFMDPTYGLSPAQVEEGKALVVAAIQQLRAAAPDRARALPLDELRPLLAFVTGGGASEAYLELLRAARAGGGPPRPPGDARSSARSARSASP